jgi:hypothetical protein
VKLDVTTRAGWGARTNRIGYPLGRVGRLIVHHFWRPDVPADATRSAEREVMRGVEAFHAAKGWSAAPGYQLVVFDSSRVYVGSGLGRTGVHTVGYNAASIAVCFGNDGDAAAATLDALAAAYGLQLLAVDGGHLASAYTLTGHRDHAAKSCPGNRTYPLIGRIRTGEGLPIGPTEPEDRDMIHEGQTKGDGQCIAAVALANRLLKARRLRQRVDGQDPPEPNLLPWDDEATPRLHRRVNWLLDTYDHDGVSRRKQGTITAGGLAILGEACARERERIMRIRQRARDAGQTERVQAIEDALAELADVADEDPSPVPD